MSNSAAFAKGFKGSREIVATNASGWQIVIDGRFVASTSWSLDRCRRNWSKYTVIGVGGNVLSLASDASKYVKTVDGFEFV
jgi:photosystem II stability/assembly factor-like uncharacterized protein